MANRQKKVWSITVDCEFIEDGVKYSCSLIRVKNSSGLSFGDIRPVLWKDGCYYKAKIKDIRCDGTYDVQFLADRKKLRVTVDQIQDNSIILPGDIREIRWKDGRWYPARITKIDSRKHNTNSVGVFAVEQPSTSITPVDRFESEFHLEGNIGTTHSDEERYHSDFCNSVSRGNIFTEFPAKKHTSPILISDNDVLPASTPIMTQQKYLKKVNFPLTSKVTQDDDDALGKSDDTLGDSDDTEIDKTSSPLMIEDRSGNDSSANVDCNVTFEDSDCSNNTSEITSNVRKICVKNQSVETIDRSNSKKSKNSDDDVLPASTPIMKQQKYLKKVNFPLTSKVTQEDDDALGKSDDTLGDSDDTEKDKTYSPLMIEDRSGNDSSANVDCNVTFEDSDCSNNTSEITSNVRKICEKNQSVETIDRSNIKKSKNSDDDVLPASTPIMKQQKYLKKVNFPVASKVTQEDADALEESDDTLGDSDDTEKDKTYSPLMIEDSSGNDSSVDVDCNLTFEDGDCSNKTSEITGNVRKICVKNQSVETIDRSNSKKSKNSDDDVLPAFTPNVKQQKYLKKVNFPLTSKVTQEDDDALGKSDDTLGDSDDTEKDKTYSPLMIEDRSGNDSSANVDCNVTFEDSDCSNNTSEITSNVRKICEKNQSVETIDRSNIKKSKNSDDDVLPASTPIMKQQKYLKKVNFPVASKVTQEDADALEESDDTLGDSDDTEKDKTYSPLMIEDSSGNDSSVDVDCNLTFEDGDCSNKTSEITGNVRKICVKNQSVETIDRSNSKKSKNSDDDVLPAFTPNVKQQKYLKKVNFPVASKVTQEDADALEESDETLGDSDDTEKDKTYSPLVIEDSSENDSSVDVDCNLTFEDGDCSNKTSEITSNVRKICVKNQSFETIERSNSKRSKRNKNFCFFCETMVLDFSRHIERNHSNELEVQKIIITKKGAEKNNLIATLRKKGNFINAAAGNIKPVKKLKTLSPSKVKACPYCLGYYARNRLWRHKNICSKNDGRPQKTFSHELFPKSKTAYGELILKVFPRMHASNNANKLAKSDPLICAYGTKYLKTHRQEHQATTCSRKMRELAMVLLEAKKINKNIENLLHSLKPEYFDIIIQAAKLAAGYNVENGTFRDATFAMNISTSLKECCEIAILDALKKKHTQNGEMYEKIEAELNTTILLIKSQWKSELSHQAADHLHTQKMNKIQIVPLAGDLKLLREYLITKGEESAETLKINPFNVGAFKTLVECVYLRVLLLCRKRPGELQRLTVDSYQEADNNKNNYEEFKNSVTPTEAILLKSFKRVVVKGKRKATPVLFSPDVQNQIDVILSVRGNFIENSNQYLFSVPGLRGPILGYKLLKKYAQLAKCKKPQTLSTRTLRKHLATICQLFHLRDEEVEQLSTFMGHTQGTHRQNYRLPDNVFQTSKILKLLLMMEKGEGDKFKGKSLEEIDVPLEFQDISNDDSSDDEPEPLPLGIIITPEQELPANTSVNVQNPRKIKAKREIHKWTNEQRKLVAGFFQAEISGKIPPKKEQVNKLYKTYPDINFPSKWEKIKVFVQNIYTNKTKLKYINN